MKIQQFNIFKAIRHMSFLIIGISAAIGVSTVEAKGLVMFPSAQPDAKKHGELSGMWDLEELLRSPRTWPLPEGQLAELKIPEGTITPLFFEGPLLKGKPTRVFAWVGMPANADRNHPVPGIVLVHGGGGTAFRDWVQLWVKRGYAAIAMDTCGNVPLSAEGMTPKVNRHQWAGPSPDQTNALEPVADQWPYHAVASVIRAHSLLGSLPGADSARIGITGISWGGVWTEVVMGLDARFRFAVPVYGAGFFGENSPSLEGFFQRLPPEKVRRWLNLWDPSQYLPFSQMPVLFVNGTNDNHFRTDVWRKTCRLAGGPTSLFLAIRMPHGHPPAGDPEEVAVFADSIVRNGVPLVKITGKGRDRNRAWVSWESSSTPVARAELVYTLDSGPWQDRKWESSPAEKVTGRAEAEVPANATAFYFNIHDMRGRIVSCEHWEGEEK